MRVVIVRIVISMMMMHAAVMDMEVIVIVMMRTVAVIVVVPASARAHCAVRMGVTRMPGVGKGRPNGMRVVGVVVEMLVVSRLRRRRFQGSKLTNAFARPKRGEVVDDCNVCHWVLLPIDLTFRICFRHHRRGTRQCFFCSGHLHVTRQWMRGEVLRESFVNLDLSKQRGHETLRGVIGSFIRPSPSPSYSPLLLLLPISYQTGFANRTEPE
jgi:hypothetical protein